MKKTIIAILIFAVTNLLLADNQSRWERNEILKYDGSGYYLYLPATIIYNDLGDMKFYKHIDSVYHPSNERNYYALYKSEKTNRYTNKYSIGVSLGELPLFLLAHWHTKHFNKKYPADGYSVPYQFSVGISNMLWSIIGLIILSVFLRKYFSDGITALTVLVIGFGTNLYCYTNLEFGLSHSLEFMIFSAILYFTQRWYASYRSRDAIYLGLFLGWALIARPVDFIVILLPILWPITATTNIKFKRLMLFWQNKKSIFLCTMSCLLISSIQLAYWKYTSGNFIHFSYAEEGFNFNKPEILDGLFSFRKGWFVYTPIALIALTGLIPMYFQQPKLLLPILFFFIPYIYVVFSWWMWWYGWGFGARPMVETYAILSIPLAALIAWVQKQRITIKILSFCVFSFFIWLNIYQTEQYKIGTIHGEYMNQRYYWNIWNKMHPSPEDRKSLNL